MAQAASATKPAEPDPQATVEQAPDSTGSDSGDKDAVIDASAPYGTRSRNRNGTSRPNYAEDKDIEMDVYDYYHDKKDVDGKRLPRQSGPATNGDVARGGTASRKTSGDEGDSKTASSTEADKQRKNRDSAQSQKSKQDAKRLTRRKPPSQQTGGAVTTATTRKSLGSTPAAPTVWPHSNMLTFHNCKARLENGRMVADDGTQLEANDHVYLVCEPPGEPYYLGRIMEFLHMQNDESKPIDAVRINWYYRPKDIGRKVTDTRLVFATMHSDISPLTALRGKCQIRHRVEIDSMDDYRKMPNSFWYEKLYDRYIQKNYDLIPTTAIVNVPEKVKKVLDERWKYVLVEQGRGKELTSAVKLCKRCSGYCASNDSVDCAVCKNTYHMNCVRPPLLKKPSRGFAWSCAACSRAQERKLEARNTPANNESHEAEDDDFLDEDDDDFQCIDTARASPTDDDHHHQGTKEQIYHASLWPYRYLGIHCKPEDALDYDDRIYPRASTRIGPRHQAPVGPWPGRPVQYVKPESKKGAKKDVSARPKWLQDQPPGYLERGMDRGGDDPDSTSTLLWKPPPSSDTISPKDIEKYMEAASDLYKELQLPKLSTNLQDIALHKLLELEYNSDKALAALPSVDRKEFKEPDLQPPEKKRFEEAITKYGSELHAVMKHVKTLTAGEVVRYYYTWKKTPQGHQVWSNYSGRKGKKEAKKAEAAATKLADDVADADDDSAFDNDKAAEKKRGFMCQFCSTTSSRQWRRAPNPTSSLVNENGVKATSKDKGAQFIVALCRRCAELWRRYAIRWEDLDEVAKKVAAGSRAWKRKQDEELLKELQAAQELGLMTPERDPTPLSTAPITNGQEPPRKKIKLAVDKDGDNAVSDTGSASGSGLSKKKEKAAETAVVPEMPKPRTLPCAVCGQMEPLGDQHISCRDCRLTVHRNCYGISDHRGMGKWLCDMCTNDKSPQVSIHYKCVLCPVELTEQEFVDQPKLTHHKKKMSEKDREREKLEVMQARKAAEFYKKKQEDLNRPVNPREPLKRTADNNWVHVTCALWTSEVKFGNAKALEPAEGIPSIPRTRYDEICQVCNKQEGACVPCHQCRSPFHVECARKHGHLLGFDISPVKSSRRDQFNIVTINGESGAMSAAIWCKDHVPTKTIVHQMQDIVNENGVNALQLYAQNFKQADLALTGTVRKANLMTAAAKMSSAPAQTTTRRGSTTTIPATTPWRHDIEAPTEAHQPGEKVCISCGIDITPKWWPIDNSQERELTNGHYGTIGLEAQKFVEQRRYQCHKCHKLKRTPKPHAVPPPRPSLDADSRSPPPADVGMPPTGPPRLSSPTTMSGYREGRPSGSSWPQHHQPHAVTAAPPMMPTHPQGHGIPPHAPPAGLGYAPPAPPGRPHAYGDWGPRPGSQHGSPPRHMNGGQPPPHGTPPMSTFSSLRPPPAMPGPPSSGPPPMTHHAHNHTSQPYISGPPPSPRRMGGGPSPTPYVGPYGVPSVAPPPPPPPPPAVAHTLGNGPLAPRPEPYRPPPRPQPQPRPGFPTPHGSPRGPGGAPNREPPPSTAPRNPDNRPTSGASASPSLRNLLS